MARLPSAQRSIRSATPLSLTPASSQRPPISAASGIPARCPVLLDLAGDEVDRLHQPRLPQRAHQRMGRGAGQQRFRARAQLRRIAIVLLHPLLEHRVDGAAAPGRGGIGVDRVEALQSEDPAGIESERIGLETVDLGHRNGPRALVGGRRRAPRGMVRVRSVEIARPFADQWRARDAAGHRLQPQPEARGDGRCPGVAAGTGHEHPASAERGGEIMRGEADPPLQRRQAKLGAKPRRKPGIGRRKRRPDAFVETAENHQVGMLKPRLDQAPDEDARMLAVGWPHRHRGHHPLENDRQLDRPYPIGPSADAGSSEANRSAAARPDGPAQAPSPPSASAAWRSAPSRSASASD